MKKSTKITIAVVAIVGVIILIAGGIWFVSLINREKEPITAEEFAGMMESKNYTIVDAMDQLTGYDYYNKAYLAIDSTYTYQIEFYEVADVSNANNFYNSNVSIFQTQKGNSAIETNISGKNFAKYTLLSGGRYMVVSRVENTVIYLNVDESYKDTIDSILDEIDY